MVAELFDITPLLPALTQGELILTANNRLRNHILRAYGVYQLAQGQQVWTAPNIYPLNHWLKDCWQALQDQAYPASQVMIASAFQRQYLWEDIITNAHNSDALLQPEPLAQSADSALRSLELWRLTEKDLQDYEHQNTLSFLQWLREFKLRLTQSLLITEENSHRIIADAFTASALTPVPRIYLQGFDDIPPLTRYLLSQATTEVIELPAYSLLENQLHRVTTNDDDTEMRAAALWAKEKLEENNNAAIGIIVPNLGQCRDQVERIFTDVFEPLAALPEKPRYTLPFNFSAGTPLAATPLIYAALELLNLNRGQWDLDALCDLLQSPFFGDINNELISRTYLCARLRKLGKFVISATDLRYHSQKVCEKLGVSDTNSLATGFINLETQRRAGLGQHTAGFWVDYFQQQLTTLGWPGSRRLDSQEYQQVTLWHKVLDDFATLDSSNLRIDIYQALKQLRNLAGKTPFQAQTPDAPIQILGALEGAGLRFSHCWVMGLHHRQWPPVPAPNPLLPLPLQRQHAMPHASAERELVFARALTENYRHCATQVVFSSAHHDDENELRPSALIRAIPTTELTHLVPELISCAQQNVQTIAHARQWQLVHDARGPSLTANDTPVRGGSNLFKHQAACPFNAFARLRLGANQPDEPVAGLSAIERGNILHDALAMIWRSLQNSHNLHALADTELERLLQHAAADALRPVQQQRPLELGKFYSELEQERLVRLLAAWMTEEKKRSPFHVIAIEEKRLVNFSGLTLQLRIDRIDQLENGELLLIDYKTGSPKAKSWAGEKPDEPQLPLYAVSSVEPVAAIAFAQINAKARQWIGTGQLSTFLEGIQLPATSWPEQLVEWQKILHQLARDFIAGDARVDFKDQNAMQFAEELLPLNRFLERDAIEHLVLSGKIPTVEERS
jgi:ATP-dependent helicase/nuclease subunit B